MDLFVKCHLKLHIDITLHYIGGATVGGVA